MALSTVGTTSTPRLTRILDEMKDLYPEERAAVISPDADISWDVVVATLDAVRADGARLIPRELFPDITLAAIPQTDAP